MSNEIPLLPEVREAVFENEQNLLMYGVGGTGKTAQITCIKNYAYQHDIPLAVTSTTAKSAILIGGETIHRWSGIKLGDKPVLTIVNDILRNNKRARDNWIKTKILVMDEVSMLGKETFEKLDKVGRAVRREPYLPFGGIKLILTGDFAQLPPVKDEFCFKSKIWRN